MKYDKKWVNQMELQAHDTLMKKERPAFLYLLDLYEAACELSNGPEPNRCQHWERKGMKIVHLISDMASGKSIDLREVYVL